MLPSFAFAFCTDGGVKLLPLASTARFRESAGFAGKQAKSTIWGQNCVRCSLGQEQETTRFFRLATGLHSMELEFAG